MSVARSEGKIFFKLNDQKGHNEIFIDEVYSKAPKENYPTNRIIYNHIG